MMQDFESAEDAYATVVEKAGTVNRDKVEARVADDARRRTTTYGGKTKGKKSGILDTEADAEGFYDYEPAEAAKDSDGDGMPDEWESANGLNPSVADNNSVNADGYTALEVYLNSLMGEEMNREFTDGVVSAIAGGIEMNYDAATSTLSFSENASGTVLSIYDARGALVEAVKVGGMSASVAHLPAGVLLVRLDADGFAPRVLKIVR